MNSNVERTSSATRPTIALLVLLMTGCGGDNDPPLDASVVDAGRADEDAMVHEMDAGESEDAGDASSAPDDAAIDAPVLPDRDMDGTPDSLDCDADDVAVGPTAERACDGFCGAGLERCTDGVWVACADVDPSCMCETEGEFRNETCARCGMQLQRCDSGRWTDRGECTDQRTCEAGTRDHYADACGMRDRECTAECEWGPLVVVGDPGNCATPGTVECMPVAGWRFCQDDCWWSTTRYTTCPLP